MGDRMSNAGSRLFALESRLRGILLRQDHVDPCPANTAMPRKSRDPLDYHLMALEEAMNALEECIDAVDVIVPKPTIKL